MQIVIDIPEEQYKRICDHTDRVYDMVSLLTIVENGTPLPKGHGRLIDADYEVSSDGRTVHSVCGYLAPTIIEADKENEDES